MSMTPDCRKVGTGMAPSPAPFFTPRPERRRPESRGLDWNSNRQDKDKEVNVQVLLRCRPLTDDEQRANVPKVITCNENRREVNVLQSIAGKQVDRVFSFDKVFGPKSQQRAIYDQAISPIVSEVLEGFNCTVFAYGQTGTGKTYTMEGCTRNKGGELPVEAGVIPRAVRQIFDTLEAQNADYNMKVTFLELYNEEITDLLSPDDQQKCTEERPKKQISLMEDGKGSVIIRGLEEEAVYSASEIYSLLERGAARRRTADSLLNKRSSRSHSIFTITIYIKEGNIGEEELVKCGKLNLVDLAGSENISRSGARESRAREAGEINKSLLTLGRVINALVEHSLHVPYRDSKLTRLLRDSLGGKTKTCIIATISPSGHCLEESLSMLDYAHRAKSIKNKPEANQKVSKALLLKDLYLEIERMKQDVRAAREKNGVYIPHERFLQDEAEKKAKSERIQQLESDLSVSEMQLDKFRKLYLDEQEEKLNVESELKECKMNLENTCKKLEDLQENHRTALSLLKEKETMISRLQHSENNLIDCANKLRVDLQDASKDISSLFEKIDQKDKMEMKNQSVLHRFGAQLDKSLKHLHEIILSHVSQQEQQLKSTEDCIDKFLANKYDLNKSIESKIQKLTETSNSGLMDLKGLSNVLQTKTSSDLEEMKAMISVQASAVDSFFKTSVLEAREVIVDIQNSLNEQRELLAFSARQQAEGLSRILASAEAISSASINFSRNLHEQASELVKLLEKSQNENCRQLQDFEKMFKEEAFKEETLAMEKIAAILSSLTARKTFMVSKAAKSFEDFGMHESKKLLLGLSSMQQVLTTEMKELNEYAEKVKDHYIDDTFSSTECKAAIENCLQECMEKVVWSGQQWQNAHEGMKQLAKSGLGEAECVMQRKVDETRSMHNNIASISSSMHAEFNSRISGLLIAVNDSLTLDKENKKKLDLISATSFEQLNSIRGNHSERISEIHSKSEHCIHNEYLVENKTDSTPKKRVIQIPSMESIEEMRMLIHDLDPKNRSKLENTDKILLQQERTPFQDVNRVI